MSRFYVPSENIGDKEIVIEGKEAHHITDVMRLVEGDEVVVFDGTGSEYTGKIKAVNPHRKRVVVEITLTERPPQEAVPEVTLAQAIPKKGKIEYIPFPEHLKGHYQSYTQADISKLRSAGYDNQLTTLEDAIKDYIQNYLAKNDYLGST